MEGKPHYTYDELSKLVEKCESLNDLEFLANLFEEDKQHYPVFMRLQMSIKLLNQQIDLTRANHNVGKN